MSWRRWAVGSGSVVGLIAALQQDVAKSAYYSDPETFMGILLAAPVLSGLLAAAIIIVFDLVRSDAERRLAFEGFQKDPRAWTISAVKMTAMIIFLGAMLLALFGLDWLFPKWFLAVALLVNGVLIFFF